MQNIKIRFKLNYKFKMSKMKSSYSPKHFVPKKQTNLQA